ncbi:MAG: hypothetical protein S4CHLAM6_03880 [Chlamydiae bacterium]|nr:hypothetical protein [Chlamydiota bacterium]
MLKFLFSNPNIEKILLFLFVNEKGYGSQIQNILKIALTPIQNALMRLEKGEIVTSYFEGNKKMFRLNYSHPLCEELENLLKKAYTLLSPQEKKYYCLIHKPRLSFQNELIRNKANQQKLLSFWNRLTKVKSLDLTVRNKQVKIQNKKTGRAQIEVSFPSENQLIFFEKGYWHENNLPKTSFSNYFRWSLDLNSSLITLEHLRQGLQNPTFLFHLTLQHSKSLISLDAHLSHQDTYLGALNWSSKDINFDWRIIGPDQNQFLNYHYV